MNQSYPDPAPITRFLRAKASAHLLVAAVHRLHVFDHLAEAPLDMEQLREKLRLATRPAMVLIPALLAMGLIERSSEGLLAVSPLGQFLCSSNKYQLTGYTGLENDDPGVDRVTSWLLHDGPADAPAGFSYVKDDEALSPMDEASSARFFTMALAGRARYLAPLVAAALPAGDAHLLDVAGGSGYYTFEWLRANPAGTATLFDRPEVLRVAEELLVEFCEQDDTLLASMRSRIRFQPGDMLTDPLPQTGLMLAASLFHDWPEKVCRELTVKFAAALTPGGQLWIHDAFLDDTLDGPLAVTDYSTMLFLGTKGRCYSRQEYRQWLADAGLVNDPFETPTQLDYGLIYATKPS